MSTSKKFLTAIRAACPVIVIESVESPARIIRMLTLADNWPNGLKRYWWSVASGLSRASNALSGPATPPGLPPPENRGFEMPDGEAKFERKPAEMLRWLIGQGANAASAAKAKDRVVFMLDAADVFKSVEVASLVRDIGGEYGELKEKGCHLVLLVEDETQLPAEVTREAIKIQIPLVDRTMRQAIITNTVNDTNKSIKDDKKKITPPTGENMDRLLNESAGLLAFSVEQACACSLVENRSITPEYLRAEVERQMRRTGCLSMIDTADLKFSSVAGMDDAKRFLEQTCAKTQPDPRLRFKGVLFLGVPGAGKSMLARAMAGEFGLRCVEFKMSSVLGSLVGQSETKMREALAVIDGLGRAVVVIDEIEKMLGAGGERDGGVMSRLLGMFLNWLNDRQSEAILVATCNDLSKLPPEFSRAERWDMVYYVDVPDDVQRKQLLDIYSIMYKVPYPQTFLPATQGWTGAEVKSVFKTAAMTSTGVEEAAKRIVPVTVRMEESLTELREWASKGAVDASTGRPYQKPDAAAVAGGPKKLRRARMD